MRQSTGEPRQDRKVAAVSRLTVRCVIPGDFHWFSSNDVAYVSLYRKYRSQSFTDLIGQEHVIRTLRNAIASGRIAHSYLFTGPRGTGKTSTARLLAKALCCENGPSADFDMDSPICRSIADGSCVDVIEMDAASESSVDAVREKIVEAVEYRPMMCRYKVFIIDEVHDLSGKAFDALLKTVEEPPEHIIFILATTEYNKVPPTIRSRCQRYEFHRASMSDLVGRLQFVLNAEGVEAEPAAVTAIARMADGGYRDALTLLEQAMLTTSGVLTVQHVYDQLGLVSDESVDALLMAIKSGDVKGVMVGLQEISRLGRDPRAIVESMLYRLADLTRAAYEVDSGTDVARDASLHETATRLGVDHALRLRGLLAETLSDIRDITLPRLWLESELVRMAIGEPPVAATPARATEPARPNDPNRSTRPEPARSEPRQTFAESTKAEVTPVGDSWDAILADIKPHSKVLHGKLSESIVASDDGTVLTISVPMKAHHEWLIERPKAIEVVATAVRNRKGDHYRVEVVLGKSDAVRSAPSAVELPLEGDRLVQRARELFTEPSSHDVAAPEEPDSTENQS